MQGYFISWPRKSFFNTFFTLFGITTVRFAMVFPLLTFEKQGQIFPPSLAFLPTQSVSEKLPYNSEFLSWNRRVTFLLLLSFHSFFCQNDLFGGYFNIFTPKWLRQFTNSIHLTKTFSICFYFTDFWYDKKKIIRSVRIFCLSSVSHI